MTKMLYSIFLLFLLSTSVHCEQQLARDWSIKFNNQTVGSTTARIFDDNGILIYTRERKSAGNLVQVFQKFSPFTEELKARCEIDYFGFIPRSSEGYYGNISTIQIYTYGNSKVLIESSDYDVEKNKFDFNIHLLDLTDCSVRNRTIDSVALNKNELFFSLVVNLQNSVIIINDNEIGLFIKSPTYCGEGTICKLTLDESLKPTRTSFKIPSTITKDTFWQLELVDKKDYSKGFFFKQFVPDGQRDDEFNEETQFMRIDSNGTIVKSFNSQIFSVSMAYNNLAHCKLSAKHSHFKCTLYDSELNERFTSETRGNEDTTLGVQNTPDNGMILIEGYSTKESGDRDFIRLTHVLSNGTIGNVYDKVAKTKRTPRVSILNGLVIDRENLFCVVVFETNKLYPTVSDKPIDGPGHIDFKCVKTV